MSQEQPRRPQEDRSFDQEPIRYADTGKFIVVTEPAGDLSNQTRVEDIDANITIGEALEATAMSIGDKPIDYSDAAAIEAAERRATDNSNDRQTGSLGAMAMSAANFNSRAGNDEDRITISDLVSGATSTLPSDKAVTIEDAEGVMGAEVRIKADSRTTPGGVAEAMVAAARVNLNEPAA